MGSLTLSNHITLFNDITSPFYHIFSHPLGNPPKNDSHLKVEFSHNAVKITEKEILHETLKIQR